MEVLLRTQPCCCATIDDKPLSSNEARLHFVCQEQVSLGQGYLKQPFQVKDGYVDLPRGPGLGIELDEDALAEKIGHRWLNQESYDADDGSVVDW